VSNLQCFWGKGKGGGKEKKNQKNKGTKKGGKEVVARKNMTSPLLQQTAPYKFQEHMNKGERGGKKKEKMGVEEGLKRGKRKG